MSTIARSVSAIGFLVIFAVLLLAWPGSVGATSTTITINDASLVPDSISIAFGGSVVWHNATSVGQVVTIERSMVLPEIAPGATSGYGNPHLPARIRTSPNGRWPRGRRCTGWSPL